MGQTVQLIMSGQNSTFLDSKAYHIHALMSHGYMRGGRFIYSCESWIYFLREIIWFFLAIKYN